MATIAAAAGLVIAAGVGAYSAVSSGNAARKAAEAQTGAANQATEAQERIAQEQLAFQRQVYDDTQRRLSPYAAVGYEALPYLKSLTLAGGGATPLSLPQPLPSPQEGGGQLFFASGQPAPLEAIIQASQIKSYTNGTGPSLYTAQGVGADQQMIDAIAQSLTPLPGGQTSLPGGVLPPGRGETGIAPQFDFGPEDFQRDPSYQFRLNEGLKQVERSAASRGGATGGNALKAITAYGQEAASQEYGNAYNRALGRFTTNVNAANNERDRQFNRLAALAGVGQTSTTQLNQAGANAVSQQGQTLGTLGQQVGSNILGAGNARASGYVGATNAFNQGLTNVANTGGQFANYLQLQQFLDRLKTQQAGSVAVEF